MNAACLSDGLHVVLPPPSVMTTLAPFVVLAFSSFLKDEKAFATLRGC
jgi:hypothetical protein